MKRGLKISFFALLFTLFLSSGLFLSRSTEVYAAAGEVEVKGVDYDTLVMTINPSGNSVVYFSTDKSHWNELEYYTTSAGLWVMDISWVTVTKDTTVYLKGNTNKRMIEVTLPKQNTSIKAVYSKADGTLTMSNYEEAEHFQWRKSTDYYWTTVSLDEGDSTYQAFLLELEQFKVKGAKLIVRTAQIPGTSDGDPGVRPSKEVTVNITKRGNAPTVSLNIKTYKLNTTERLEYSLDDGTTWMDCLKSMELKDVLPGVFQANSGTADSVLFRTTATTSAPHSKQFTLSVPGQKAAPTTVSHYTQDNKYLFLQFSDASPTLLYEYTVIKPGKVFDETVVSWKTVKTSNLIKLSKSTAPEGTKIYYRYKGVTANISKGIGVELPSAFGSFPVTYQ